MPGESVGAHAFVDLGKDEGKVGLASSSADAAHGGDVDGGVIKKPGPQERDQGQHDAGGIATGRGDEAGGFDLLAVDLGKAEDRLAKQLGRGVG